LPRVLLLVVYVEARGVVVVFVVLVVFVILVVLFCRALPSAMVGGVHTTKVAPVIGLEEPAGVLKEAKAVPPDHAE
jgi:hypothetical protein